MRVVKLLPVVWLLFFISGCATARLPSGPEVFSPYHHKDKVTIGIIKVQDSRDDKKAGAIGLAPIYVEGKDLTNMVTNYLIDCINRRLQFNVINVSAYQTNDMKELTKKHNIQGIALLNITKLEMNSFDAIIESVKVDMEADLQIFNKDGEKVYEDIFKGHYEERIGMVLNVDKATGELVEEVTKKVMDEIAITERLRGTLKALQ